MIAKHKNMAQPWCLATNPKDATASSLVKMYGRCFTVEETFRDPKDLRFGKGISSTPIKSPHRRDRLLFLLAMAQTLLTLLGQASE